MPRRSGALLAVALFLVVPSLACGPGRGGSRRRSTPRLSPLVFKQHVPNVPELNLAASGPFEGKVTRNHPQFKELVPNYSTELVFRDEEGDGQDRIMTPRCKSKLDTLAISTMNQWPGIKVRITEAWDTEGFHAPNSLHFSGRAVDITTSDRDRSKNGLLARLAVEAGFDYVYFASKSYVHASVKSEQSADAARSGGCFSSNAHVITENGSARKMAELSIGDKVLVLKDGHFGYSEVIMFLDRDESEQRLYKTIETESGVKVTLTPSHLIYTTDNERTVKVTDSYATFARNVEPGMYIFVHSNSSKDELGKVSLEKVTAITFEKKVGVFAPLTREGNLVVNNVLVSCYATFELENLAHWAFLPVRLADNFSNAVAHFLKKMIFIRLKRKKYAESKHTGIHWYPKLLYMVTHYMLPDRYLYR